MLGSYCAELAPTFLTYCPLKQDIIFSIFSNLHASFSINIASYAYENFLNKLISYQQHNLLL